MNKIYCNVWSKVRNAMVVASELARGAGKGKNGGVRASARSRRLNAAVVAMALGCGAGVVQAANVTVDADGTAETLNATDTYIKITAKNGGTVDAAGNAVEILGNDPSSDGSGVVVLRTGGQLVLDGGGTLDNTHTTSGSHGIDAKETNTLATLNGVAISAQGDSSHAVVVARGAKMSVTDGTVSTVGDWGHGYQVTNGTLEIIGGAVTTYGQGALGIQASGDSSVTLTDGVMINTEGLTDGSNGILATNTSSVSMRGGNISIKGTRAHGIRATNDALVTLTDDVVIDTDGIFSYGLSTENQSAIDMSDGSITTIGNNAHGANVTDGSGVTLTGVGITTIGNNAHGVNAIYDSGATLTGVTIEANGEGAYGISTKDNAQATMTGGTITTKGHGADGVWATDTSQVTLSDGVVIRVEEESGRGIYASSDTQVQMTGGSITTEGEESHAILAENDSTVTLTDNVAITAQGTTAAGIRAANNASVTMSGGSVSTQGALFYDAVNVTDAASVVLNDGVAISTANDFAAGISSRDDSTVTMTGGSISTTGVLAAGTMSDSNSTMTLNDVAITTVGDNAYGALVNDSAQLTLNDTSVNTSGADATGVVAVQFAQLALSNASITTTGAGAMGLSVENDASAHLNQVTMDTAGASIGRNLYSSGLSPQPILITNSDLTRNNGVLLEVTGSNLTDPTVLQLTDGTVAMGDITDVSTTNRNTLSLASGSQWTGVSRMDGNLTLTDAGTATHGGTVAAPIQISGDVTVNNGAALGGNLNVGGMLSGSSGALRPGNSIGTQTFASAGGFTGDYHAEVNAAGQSDLITVTSGNFDLTGINLYVDEADGNGGYKLDHDYTIVATGDASGISGMANNEFANGGELEGNLAASLVKLDPVIYGDDVVKIRLSVDEAKQLTLTHNQNAVVEAAQANPAVQKAVQMVNYADALDHLSGEIHASTQTALLDTGNLMQRTLVNRMRGNSGSPSCANAAGLDQDRVDNAAACGLDYPLWAQVVGSWNHHDGDDNTASTRYRLGGLYLGGDKTFDNGWRIGGAVGFTDGKIDADDRDSKADVKSYTAALYGGKGWVLSKGQLNMLVGAGYTYHDIDTDRHTDVLGSQSLSAGYHANSTQLFAELGYALPVSDAAYVEPYLNLGWTDLRTKGFSESGGSTALQADSDHNQIFTQTLGLRGGTAITAGKTDISLLAGLGWRHASGDLDATRTMAFSQGGGERFEIKGAPIAKNAAVLDLGAEARLGENTALGLSYSGQFSSRGNDNTGSLYLRMKF